MNKQENFKTILLNSNLYYKISRSVSDRTDVIAYDIQGKMSKRLYNQGYKHITTHVWDKVVVQVYNHVERQCKEK